MSLPGWLPVHTTAVTPTRVPALTLAGPSTSTHPSPVLVLPRLPPLLLLLLLLLPLLLLPPLPPLLPLLPLLLPGRMALSLATSRGGLLGKAVKPSRLLPPETLRGGAFEVVAEVAAEAVAEEEGGIVRAMPPRIPMAPPFTIVATSSIRSHAADPGTAEDEREDEVDDDDDDDEEEEDEEDGAVVVPVTRWWREFFAYLFRDSSPPPVPPPAPAAAPVDAVVTAWALFVPLTWGTCGWARGALRTAVDKDEEAEEEDEDRRSLSCMFRNNTPAMAPCSWTARNAAAAVRRTLWAVRVSIVPTVADALFIGAYNTPRGIPPLT